MRRLLNIGPIWLFLSIVTLTGAFSANAQDTKDAQEAVEVEQDELLDEVVDTSISGEDLEISTCTVDSRRTF